MQKMYHLDTFFLCIVVVIFMNSESVASLFGAKPGFIKRPEGSVADMCCESADLYHQWYQGYEKGAMGYIPLQNGTKTTHYNITVEKFDNNTHIYCKNETKQKDTSKELGVFGIINKAAESLYPSLNQYFVTSIKVIETSKSIEESKILRYSKTKNVTFSCEEYVSETQNKIYLGVINTTSNIIATHLATSVSVSSRFNSTHNGTTVLCCIYYDVNGTDDEKWINRHVVKKTMLIYDDNIWNDALNCSEGNHAIIIYITAAVAVIFILVVIAFCKKRCRKDTESDTKVLYVDLDILRTEPATFERPRPEDEPSYAQIIGVMRPELT